MFDELLSGPAPAAGIAGIILVLLFRTFWQQDGRWNDLVAATAEAAANAQSAAQAADDRARAAEARANEADRRAAAAINATLECERREMKLRRDFEQLRAQVTKGTPTP